MKNVKYYFLVGLCLVATGNLCRAQYATPTGKKAGDLIESTSYNDHKRGKTRTMQYQPDGEDFVCINGKNRYTRALYGSHTAWRLETSDRPIFATYVKKESRNIRFRLLLPNGKSTALEETSWCEARYTPGRRSYQLKDEAWGEKAILEMVVLPSMEAEEAVWQVQAKGLPKGTELEVLVSPIRIPNLSRSGDMGADPPGCFDPAEEGSALQQFKVALPVRSAIYLTVANNEMKSLPQGASLFTQYEKARQELAQRIQIETPDPYLNTLGGALAMAADGIWDEQVWQHGAVGWRMPLSGWRAAYTGDVLGWHDRARTHFDAYAASQVTNVPNTIPHPAQDEELAFARSLKKWGTPQYSNGYICRNPYRSDQMHHYDMNLCYIDELLWHFCWTGDLEYARQMWPVIERHLAWEKLNFDPDNDGLYDAYACIWASDALYYNSGAVTHSTAYNYRANRMAAMIAEKIGKNPLPYQTEADKILKALNERLWLHEEGCWAEYQDFMGLKRLHKHPGVWTIYHAIDGGIATPLQAYRATQYIDREIPHIPVQVPLEGEYATIATTNWLPYSWSINNVAFAEVMNTALAYFQAGRAEAGFKLLKSSVLDGMYLGESPGNFGQISFYDAARGECYRDFGDPIGVASRLLIQGLYGVIPDALNGRLLLKPGFPQQWDHASLHTPDIDFRFAEAASKKTSYTFTHRLPAVNQVELQFPARYAEVEAVQVNGRKYSVKPVEGCIEQQLLSLNVPARPGEHISINIVWKGSPLPLAPLTDTAPKYQPSAAAQASVAVEAVSPQDCVPVVMDEAFNASVTDIFRNRYLTPRSPYTTLQLPVQGIGEWCHPLMTAEIDDSGLRNAVQGTDLLQTHLGIRFRTPSQGKNIAFASLWDNYPNSLRIPLQGRATRAYLLLAGSTNHMQCHIDNALIRVHYKDGSSEELPLINPTNWAPIEQAFFEDGKAFNRHTPPVYRLRLQTAELSNRLSEELGTTNINRMIPGGAATLLQLSLNPAKELSHLSLEVLSNDVVIGVMAVTLLPATDNEPLNRIAPVFKIQ